MDDLATPLIYTSPRTCLYLAWVKWESMCTSLLSFLLVLRLFPTVRSRDWYLVVVPSLHSNHYNSALVSENSIDMNRECTCFTRSITLVRDHLFILFRSVPKEMADIYVWREIPRAVSCVVPAGSLPPSIIYEVSINDVIFNRANGSLWLNATVTPPENIKKFLVCNI